MSKISKRNLIIAGSATTVIAAIIILYFLFGRGASLKLSSVEVKKGDVTEKINLTGQVKASQGVDLAFEGPGKIVANYVKVGDRIYAGQALLSIDDSVLENQLSQANAQLAQAEAGVDILNIDTIKSKTDAGLQTLYTSSLNASQKSINTAKDILLTISDIQYNHFISQNPQNTALQDAKAKAVESLLGQANAGLWASQYISGLNGGTFTKVQTAIDNPTHDNIDLALSSTQTALQDIIELTNTVPIDSSLTSAERTTISSLKTGANIEAMTTAADIQAISALKVNNSATITTTNSQIEGAKASVEVVKANIKTIENQISKTTIRALFNGKVDKNDAIVGSIVSAGSPVITISNNNLEIQTYIPEINIADTKIGSNANITLDAYGTNKTFPAKVVSVDSAQTIINGITAYKARLKFVDNDEKIKSGMTANITIMPETRSNVLLIPKSALMQKSGKYFVIIDKGNSQKENREVVIGLKDDTNAEIISGLNLGEKVLSY